MKRAVERGRAGPARRLERAPRRAAAGGGPDPAAARRRGRGAAWAAGAWIPIAATAAGVALRAWAWRGQPYVTIDGTEYVRIAEAMLRGEALASIFPPGYPALVALARLAVPDRLGAAVAVSMLAGALLPAITWWLARRAVGPRAAAVPAFAVALHPELARFSALSMSESAYLAALYGGVALAAAGRGAASGLAVGLAYAIRPEGLVAAAVLAARGAWRRARGRATWRATLRGAAGFLVVAVPCVMWFHATLGLWTPTPKLSALRAPTRDWREAEPRSLPPAPGAAARRAGAPERLAEIARSVPGNVARQGRGLLVLWPWPLLALSLWGLARRRGVESVPLAYLAGLPLLGLSLQPRFALAAVPALAIAATVPLVRERPRAARAAAVLLLAGGAAACAWGNAPVLGMIFDGSAQFDRRAGQWLARIAEPGDVVLDRKPFVAFYAGCAYAIVPDDPYEEIVRGAVERGARWLVVSQRLARTMRPQLEPLLYDAAFRARERRLELAYVGGVPELGEGLAVFRVLAPGEAARGIRPVDDRQRPVAPPPR